MFKAKPASKKVRILPLKSLKALVNETLARVLGQLTGHRLPVTHRAVVPNRAWR